MRREMYSLFSNVCSFVEQFFVFLIITVRVNSMCFYVNVYFMFCDMANKHTIQYNTILPIRKCRLNRHRELARRSFYIVYNG